MEWGEPSANHKRKRDMLLVVGEAAPSTGP